MDFTIPHLKGWILVEFATHGDKKKIEEGLEKLLANFPFARKAKYMSQCAYFLDKLGDGQGTEEEA